MLEAMLWLICILHATQLVLLILSLSIGENVSLITKKKDVWLYLIPFYIYLRGLFLFMKEIYMNYKALK